MAVQHDMSVKAAPAISPLLVGALLVAGLLGVYIVPMQVNSFIDSLHLSASRSGLLGTMEVAGMSITTIVVSPLLDRWPLARLTFWALLAAAAGETITALATTFWIVAATRLLVGIGCGIAYASVAFAVANTRDPDRAMGFGQAVANGVFLLLFLLLPSLIGYFGRRGLFLSLAAGLALISTAANCLPKVVTTSTHSTDFSGSCARASGTTVSLFFLGLLLLNAGLGALWGFAERIGLEIGLGEPQIGLVLSACTVAMIAGSMIAGLLGNRLGRRLPVVVAALLSGASAYLTASASTGGSYAAALILYNLSYLFLGPYLVVGVPSELDPSGRLAVAAGGMMWLSYSAGLTAGGIISDSVNVRAIGLFSLVSCVVAAALFSFTVARRRTAVVGVAP